MALPDDVLLPARGRHALNGDVPGDAPVQDTDAQWAFNKRRFDLKSGCGFLVFRINDLEMVAQIFTRWNRLANWLKEAEGYAAAA